MKILKRGALVAATVAASVVMLAGSASAAITPNPYSTSVGTGSFTATSSLGSTTCNLSGIRANAVSTTGGANGTISGFTASGCAGVVTAARYTLPITLSINRGAVTANVAILITNFLGGNCLYTGTLTGTMANGGNSATVSGTVNLAVTLSGFCTSTAGARLTATFPGARVTW